MQNFTFDHPSIRYTGRFGLNSTWSVKFMAATACGAYFEIAFFGGSCVLRFNTEHSSEPFGHVYISVDGSSYVESAITPFIRVSARDNGAHLLTCIYKSGVEQQHRWHQPLVGKMAFEGYEAEDAGILPPDTRKSVEFVGDSITEGVLIEAFRKLSLNDQHNRPWQDDVTGTYAWLTAEKLGLRPFMMGYGAVGNTHGGCGGVPKTADAYPFNFEGSPVAYPPCDYIVINHGANDRGSRDSYLPEYRNVLKLIRLRNKSSKIIVLSPFCGAFDDVLPGFVEEFNREFDDNIYYISSHGWVPAEPLHPLRDGHAIIAEKLSAELAKIL